MPSDLPLTETSARFFTLPRSVHTSAPGLSQATDTSMDLLYVAVPEKYFMPSSGLSFQSVSFWNVAEGGAPRSAGKLTRQEPSMFSKDRSTTVGNVREGAAPAERKTT